MSSYEYACISFENDGLYDGDIREALADVFDICVNVAGVSGEKAARAFVLSGLARQFERQNSAFVAGRSGTDLVNSMLPYLGLTEPVVPQDRLVRTADYWVGFMVSYFQLRTGHPYKEIFKRFPYEEIKESYWPLHEADDTKFVQVYQGKWVERFSRTHLAELRERGGLSQSALAEKAGVGLRSIQMYEQGNKDINRANGETLYRLSLALGCQMEDLLEL